MVIRRAFFDPVLSIFALRRSSKFDWNTYIGVEHQFFGYNLGTERGVSSLLPFWVASIQLSGSKALVSAPGGDVMWLPELMYASMESCCADWRASYGEVNNGSAEVEFESVDVPEIDNPTLLLRKDALGLQMSATSIFASFRCQNRNKVNSLRTSR